MEKMDSKHRNLQISRLPKLGKEDKPKPHSWSDSIQSHVSTKTKKNHSYSAVNNGSDIIFKPQRTS